MDASLPGVGLGTAAFTAFIARETSRQFAATQFALFTAVTALTTLTLRHIQTRVRNRFMTAIGLSHASFVKKNLYYFTIKIYYIAI